MRRPAPRRRAGAVRRPSGRAGRRPVPSTRLDQVNRNTPAATAHPADPRSTGAHVNRGTSTRSAPAAPTTSRSGCRPAPRSRTDLTAPSGPRPPAEELPHVEHPPSRSQHRHPDAHRGALGLAGPHRRLRPVADLHARRDRRRGRPQPGALPPGPPRPGRRDRPGEPVRPGRVRQPQHRRLPHPHRADRVHGRRRDRRAGLARPPRRAVRRPARWSAPAAGSARRGRDRRRAGCPRSSSGRSAARTPGMPTVTAPIRNVWSASMVVRRETFMAVGGFRTGFGKLGGQNRPEDTELCLRMSARRRRPLDVRAGRGDPPRGAGRPLHLLLLPAPLLRRGARQGADGRPGRQRPTASAPNATTCARCPGPWSATSPPPPAAAASRHALKAGSVLAGVAAAGFGGAVETISSRRTVRRPVLEAGR